MSRKDRKKLIAFALESVYGQDAIDGGTPHYLLGREFSIVPMAGQSTPLEYDNGELGNSQEIVTELYVTVEFTVDMAASAEKDKQAAFGDLMKACLRKVTEVDDLEALYAIDEESSSSATLYFWQSGALHKVTGSRGSLSLSVQAKGFGGITFSFSGLYQPVAVDAVPQDPDFSAWQKPLKVGVQNSTFSIDSTPYKLITMEYDQANQVVYQEYVGHEEVIITDYQPTASIVIEAPNQSELDVFELAEAGDVHSIAFTNGPLGNQFAWSSSKVQLGRPTYGEQDGTQTLSIPLIPIGSVDIFATR